MSITVKRERANLLTLIHHQPLPPPSPPLLLPLLLHHHLPLLHLRHYPHSSRLILRNLAPNISRNLAPNFRCSTPCTRSTKSFYVTLTQFFTPFWKTLASCPNSTFCGGSACCSRVNSPCSSQCLYGITSSLRDRRQLPGCALLQLQRRWIMEAWASTLTYPQVLPRLMTSWRLISKRIYVKNVRLRFNSSR